MADSPSDVLDGAFVSYIGALQSESAPRVSGGDPALVWIVPESRDPAEWPMLLATHRWPGMHPRLLPIARDRHENLFCVCVCGTASDGGDGTIVYWSHESRLAVPIATNFEEFLRWCDTFLVDADTSDDEEIAAAHRKHLIANPAAPAAHLVMATLYAASDERDDAIDHGHLALAAFPEYSGAYVVLNKALDACATPRAAVSAALQALNLPLVFSGPSPDPYHRCLPKASVAWLVEEIDDLLSPSERDALSPAMLDLLRSPIPTFPHNWRERALEAAESGDLCAAAYHAENAFFLATMHSEDADDEATDSGALLMDIYDSLAWSQRMPWLANATKPTRRRTRARW